MDETTSIDAQYDEAFKAYRAAWMATHEALGTLCMLHGRVRGGLPQQEYRTFAAFLRVYRQAHGDVESAMHAMAVCATPLDEYACYGRRLMRYRSWLGMTPEHSGRCVETVQDRVSLLEHQCKRLASPGTDYCDQHGARLQAAGKTLRLPRLAGWDGAEKEKVYGE